MNPYNPLLTDLYQLTMAYGYWKLNRHEQEAVFQLSFRHNPFKGNYALCCGLGSVIHFLNSWRFAPDDLDYLRSLSTNGQPLFPNEFLDYLGQLQFSCDIDAIPEGTVVFPQEPLIRIQGPLLQCQLLESPLLNIINFQTLIATKASRVCQAAGKDNVIEFGLRRAQGPDGALSASRAAYIGGVVATSNTLAGKYFDIPVRGTHAHSWVSSFPTEAEAFAAYMAVMPHNCTLLVDTYNTLQGVQHAITIGEKLREIGADLVAIRLDSGDLASLSLQARQMLDAAGFEKTGILASNNLDEYVIQGIKQQNMAITAWGVGTHLVTAYDQPALDGVYKLTALRDTEGRWLPKLKLSEQAIKISTPGRHQVRRYFSNNRSLIDIIYDLDLSMAEIPRPVCLDPTIRLPHLDDYDGYADLLIPLFRKGKQVQPPISIHQIRQQAIEAVQDFKRSYHDQSYPVGLEESLSKIKNELVNAKN